MPVLDLPEEPPIEGAETFGVPIFAAMLFPRARDAAKREQWLASAMARAYCQWRDRNAHWTVLAEFHGWISKLWILPQSPKRVYEDGFGRRKGGLIAGQVLAVLLSLARHHPAYCGVEQAKELVRRNRRGKVSESAITKAWADYQTVSPFWLALRQLILAGEKFHGDNSPWLDLLALAEAIRREAESWRVLRSAKTWKAPESLNLEALNAERPPLPADQLQFVQTMFPN